MDNKEPKKKRGGVSQVLSRFRWLIQAGATLLSNIHLPNLLKGRIYQGKGKAVCVPGLIAIPALRHRVHAQSARFRLWWVRQNSVFHIISQDSSY